jgi:mRNA interferase RelE/StbE
MAYGEYVTPAFKRELKSQDRKVLKRVFGALERLADEPRPRGVEKLKENPKFYRVAVGDYRIVYSVDDKESVIVACLLRHRKDAYRDIANLDIGAVMENLNPIRAKPTTAT